MKEILKKLLTEPLSEEETKSLFDSFMAEDGEAPGNASIGAYLYATAGRTVTAKELIGGVRSLREHMIKLDLVGDYELLDTCGTGGSGLNTFNTSTASAFVCAAAGQKVAKHGNRAASSTCGSADVLEACGLKLELSPEQERACILESNFCFMYAPLHHPATKKVVIARREIGIRTIFNFLGPMSNPAGAVYQVVGISEPKLMKVMAEALGELGAKRAMVVRGVDGLDEISPCASTQVVEFGNGKLKEYEVSPEDFGFSPVTPEQIVGGEAVDSCNRLKKLLSGDLTSKETSSLVSLIAINAGAGLYISNNADSLAEGVNLAKEILKSGKALTVLENAIAQSNKTEVA